MVGKRYGKLVRDGIPDIIRENGELPTTRVMDSDEYRRELLYKLIEEAEEARQAGYDPSSEQFRAELADLQEVFNAVLAEFDITADDIERVRAERVAERGGFAGRIFLESVK